MTKQKIVLKVAMEDAKKRSKALQAAVGLSGVVSAALQGDDRDRIVVVGDGIDSVALTTMMRKKVGFTELLSVEQVKEEKEKEKEKEKPKDGAKSVDPVVWPYQTVVWPAYQGSMAQPYVVQENYSDPSCCIM